MYKTITILPEECYRKPTRGGFPKGNKSQLKKGKPNREKFRGSHAKRIQPLPGRLPPKTVNEHQLIASICRDSFWEFVQEFWEVIIPEKPVWNWHIKFLCDELQIVMERVFKGLPKEYDLIINIPPGTTKSTVASVMLTAWCWTRMPSLKSINGSYAERLALDLSRKCRDIINSDKYKACFPEIKLRDDQNTKSYYVNEQAGIRYSVGVGGSVIGMHGHIIVIDDPIDPMSVFSDIELKSTNSWMREQLSQRKVDKRVTPMILIMQRLAQHDPSGDRLSQAQANSGMAIKHICLPAEDSEHVKPPYLRKHYKNGLLDPVRLPMSVLRDALADLGEFGYSGQFRQHPVPLGGGMFKTDRIVIDTALPEKWVKIIRYWDKAGTLKGGAFTVGVKMGKDLEGRFWILNVIRVQFESSAREKLIKNTAIGDGKGVRIGIEQEGGSGGKESAQATVRNLAGFRVYCDAPKGDKSARADPFSVQVNHGNVYMVKAPWNKVYLEELEHFPYSKYKDQVDASSGCFKGLTTTRIVIGGFNELLPEFGS